MARTWGQLRFEIAKFAPGIDPQLVNEWLNGAYRDVLDHYSWLGLEKDAVLETTAPYTTGTVSIAVGSTAVVGTGTLWTSAMSGLGFSADNDAAAAYVFTYLTATTGTLDRPYEGDPGGGAAVLGGYHLFQSVYLLPSDVKYIQLLENPRANHEIVAKTRVELLRLKAQPVIFDEPQIYAPVADTAEGAPPAVLHSVELYPVPLYAAGYPYTYQKAVFQFDGTNTANSPLPWVSEDAIIAGAKARVLAHLKDYTGSALEAARSLAFRAQMFTQEKRRTGPSRLVMASRFTRHRKRRWNR